MDHLVWSGCCVNVARSGFKMLISCASQMGSGLEIGSRACHMEPGLRVAFIWVPFQSLKLITVRRTSVHT